MRRLLLVVGIVLAALAFLVGPVMLAGCNAAGQFDPVAADSLLGWVTGKVPIVIGLLEEYGAIERPSPDGEEPEGREDLRESLVNCGVDVARDFVSANGRLPSLGELMLGIAACGRGAAAGGGSGDAAAATGAEAAGKAFAGARGAPGGSGLSEEVCAALEAMGAP